MIWSNYDGHALIAGGIDFHSKPLNNFVIDSNISYLATVVNIQRIGKLVAVAQPKFVDRIAVSGI